jgi:hypothetical protein
MSTKSKSMLCAVALLSVLLPLSMASAQVPATYVFETVDSYDTNAPGSAHMQITGIIRGESAARTIELSYGTDELSLMRLEQCERMLLLAMNKPGQYFFEIRQEHWSSHYLSCKLTRR